MKVVITGGTGFLGLGIARRLAGAGKLCGQAIDGITLFDQSVPDKPPPGLKGGIDMIAGDIADRDTVFALIDRDDIAVFHLASVVSAGGERDFDLAMRVNLDGGRNVMEALRARGGPARMVFASSIAVYGGDFPETVTDMTRTVPQTTYGMTKSVGELMINDYTRKGFLDGRAARLPTVIIRPGPPNLAASGFASGVFREPLAGQEYELPVAPETKMMVLGFRNAVRCLTGLMEADGEDLGVDRVVNLPNAAYPVEEMIEALERVAGQKGIKLGPITPRPDPAIEAIVKTWPLVMDDSRARALGLPGDDGLDSVIEDYIEDFGVG